jgi:hypothetical protein
MFRYIRGKRITRVFQLLLIACCFVPVAHAQDRTPQHDIAPPPLRVVSRAERAQINEARDPKARIKLTIELAEVHLLNSETETTKQDYDKAAAAAGRYWGLMDDAFVFLKTMKADTNKTRDLYKRVELSLRAHGPRLTAIRRATPVEYALWIKEFEELARKGRTEALNSFYGHTVFQDRQQKSSNEKPENKPDP